MCGFVCVFVKIPLNSPLFMGNQEAAYFFQQIIDPRDSRSRGVWSMESQEVISFYRLPICDAAGFRFNFPFPSWAKVFIVVILVAACVW